MSIYRQQRIEVYKKLANNRWSDTPAILRGVSGLSVDEGVNKHKDQFKFVVHNPRNALNRQYFYGDGSTTTFTLYHTVAPEVLGDITRFNVTVAGVALTFTNGTPSSGYYGVTTASGTSTLTLGSAAASNAQVVVYYSPISEDDLVIIYKYDDTVAFSTLTDEQKQARILISGTVMQGKSQSENGASVYEVQGYSFIDIVFKGLVFHRTQANNKPHLIAIEIISQLNKYNPFRRIYGESLTEWTELGNPTTKVGGSAFPTLTYFRGYDRAITFMEDIWSDKYTDDGDYIYNVVYNLSSDRYEFIVRPRTDATQGVIIEQGTNVVYSVNAERRVDKVINAVIYNIGPDANGISQEGLNFDPTQSSGIGASWLYISETNNILPNLFEEEYRLNSSDFDLTANNRRISNYPKSSALTSYDINAFTNRDANGIILGTTITVTSQITYNDAFVDEGMWLGKQAAQRIIDRNGKTMLSTSWDIRENTNYVLGSLVEVRIPSFNITSAKLRIVRRTHTFWGMDLTIEEDPPKTGADISV